MESMLYIIVNEWNELKTNINNYQGITSKYRNAFEELGELFSAGSNYANYRELVLNNLPPMIPYLGVFLKDLTFLEIGNPKYLDDDKKLLNFDKLRMISHVISELVTFQNIPYQFTPSPTIQKLLKQIVTPFDEDQLYNISRILEPVGSTKTQSSNSLMDKIRKVTT